MGSTCNSLHLAFALVGPRSAPPCFFDPPTIVGAMSDAFIFHSDAPRQPSLFMSGKRTSPTVAAGARLGAGHLKKLHQGSFIATSTDRGRSCGTPKSTERAKSQRRLYPYPASLSPIVSRYCRNFGPKSPLTFSIRTAGGWQRSTRSIASSKRFLSSSGPSCFPATEKGGHGTPPAIR